MTETEEIINELVQEGAAKPLLHPLVQSLLWLTGITLYLLAFLGFNGLRPDMSDKLDLTGFIMELTLLAVTGGTAAFAAFCLSRPDGFQVPWVKYIPILLLVLWALVAFTSAGDRLSVLHLQDSLAAVRFDCCIHIFLFSLLPGIAIFFLIRLGAAIRYYWAGVMSTLSVTVFAYLFMRLVENNDDLTHLFVWHTLPVIMMCILGIYAGRRVLRWR
jgi:hypothetical protein